MTTLNQTIEVLGIIFCISISIGLGITSVQAVYRLLRDLHDFKKENDEPVFWDDRKL